MERCLCEGRAQESCRHALILKKTGECGELLILKSGLCSSEVKVRLRVCSLPFWSSPSSEADDAREKKSVADFCSDPLHDR